MPLIDVVSARPRVDDVNGLDGSLLTGRHLCLISEGGAAAPGAALLRATLASPRVHVLLHIGGRRRSRGPTSCAASLSIQFRPAD